MALNNGQKAVVKNVLESGGMEEIVRLVNRIPGRLHRQEVYQEAVLMQAERDAMLTLMQPSPTISLGGMMNGIIGGMLPAGPAQWYITGDDSARSATAVADPEVEESPVPKPEMNFTRHLLEVETTFENDVRSKLAIDAAIILGYKRLATEMKLKPLAQVLAKLEIEVLDTEQVEKYQEEMVEHFNQLRTAEYRRRGLSFSNNVDGFRWDWREIARYDKPVPEFVLLKAIAIKQELPMAAIMIEELKEDPFLVVKFGSETYYIDVWAEPKFDAGLSAV